VFLINVAYPATATMFFSMLMQVLTFQFYDFTDSYNRILSLSPDSGGNEPLNDHFDLMGYNSLYLIQNFGTMCWTVFIAPVCWVASVVIDLASKGRFDKYRQKFNRLMFYDYWLVFLSENYVFLSVCVCLNVCFLRWYNYGDAVNSLIAIVTGLFIVAFPIFVAIFYGLKRNLDRVLRRDENFMSRFGSILEGLNFKRRGRLVLVYVCTTMVMKLWLACIVVFNQDK
jgi:hypothetical protein